jgi:predicted transcriptional regulator
MAARSARDAAQEAFYEAGEIAHLLGLSEEAVRSSLYQARKRLKRELCDRPDGGCHE